MNRKSIVLALALAAGLSIRGTGVAAPPPTDADVGDAGSFGNKATWVGVVATGAVIVTSDCTPLLPNLGPDDRCVPIAGATTPFAFPDLGRITLPANSSTTLLCHWVTPNGSYVFYNPTGAPATAEINVVPTYRLESKVLDGPPYNGGIDVVIAGYRELDTMAPGALRSRSFTATRDCVAGLVTKASLVNDYGLTPQQAAAFFQNPMTIRAGIAGHVDGKLTDATLVYHTRFIGDHP